MEVLFGERGNSFISFFQQSSGRTTLDSGHGKRAERERERERGGGEEEADCPASNQPELRAFVSSDRKQLRVNNACLPERAEEKQVKIKGSWKELTDNQIRARGTAL